MNEFKLGNRMVGAKHPPLVIAEIGINHNGSIALAKKLIILFIFLKLKGYNLN